jgi:DNA-binding CsgD family transcriptional regulator
MGRRGRPPFPDILTPREWEVLALLRENLTNDAIAARLGVTHAAAKYHVSEILSKLGVASREEAAAWEPVPAAEAGKPRLRWGVSGLVGWLRPVTLGNAALIGAAVVVVAGLGVLAWGVLRESGDTNVPAGSLAVISATPTPTPVVRSEREAVDLAMEQLELVDALRPDEAPDVSVEKMTYGEAAELFRQFGVHLLIRPEGYSCPPGAHCPYPGEPADSVGWLIVISNLADDLPKPGATRFAAWIGETGGMTYDYVP